MQFKPRRCASLVFAILALASRDLASQTPDARQHLLDIAKANSLDIEGAQPWHLRMSFQLYDLGGKPKENGTIEEWWVSPQARRLEIKSPSYNLTIPSDPSAPATHNRESYLVNQLLDQIVHPIPDYKDFNDLNITEALRKFGNVSLSCISVERAKITYTPGSPQFCFTPSTPLLRAHLDAARFAAVRNNIVTFRGIGLGRDNILFYGPDKAISGHLDTLESFHPDGSVVLTSSTPDIRAIPGVVLAGKILRKVTPDYPPIAKDERISGTVVLCVTITKQGTIGSLDVIASPHPSLTNSAIDAVKQWTYQPYLFNGQPTEIDTTITVNFNLNGG